MNILITGASGFVGKALSHSLANNNNYQLHLLIRQAHAPLLPKNAQVHHSFDMTKDSDFSEALKGIDVVIHCAARAHITRDKAIDPLHEFRITNRDITLNLAQQAITAGVKRFIFLSTIGVLGSKTDRHPFTAADTPAPHSPYAQSKLEAEIGLRELSQSSDMDVVIIRPPLVYGAHAPGNFGTLVKVLSKGIPTPLGSVNNKRSFVFINNLISFIECCVQHPNAADETFLIADGEDLSTATLIKKLSVALNQHSLSLPIPVGLLRLGAKLTGKTKIAEQLLDSLQVDIRKNQQLLGWVPPHSVDDAFKQLSQQLKS